MNLLIHVCCGLLVNYERVEFNPVADKCGCRIFDLHPLHKEPEINIAILQLIGRYADKQHFTKLSSDQVVSPKTRARNTIKVATKPSGNHHDVSFDTSHTNRYGIYSL